MGKVQSNTTQKVKLHGRGRRALPAWDLRKFNINNE